MKAILLLTHHECNFFKFVGRIKPRSLSPPSVARTNDSPSGSVTPPCHQQSLSLWPPCAVFLTWLLRSAPSPPCLQMSVTLNKHGNTNYSGLTGLVARSEIIHPTAGSFTRPSPCDISREQSIHVCCHVCVSHVCMFFFLQLVGRLSCL